jgi:Fe-S-cluster containining protein
MYIETDLRKIKKYSKTKERENYKFRSFLKQYDISIKKLDSIVHKIYNEVIKHIDCTKCANCCKVVKPQLSKTDIKRLSESMGIPEKDFIYKYLSASSDERGFYIFNTLPCPLLKDNLCQYYDHRPKDCLSYPHLHKREFIFRLYGMIDNYGICPIVYNVYEQLKNRFNDFYKFDFEDLYYY